MKSLNIFVVNRGKFPDILPRNDEKYYFEIRLISKIVFFINSWKYIWEFSLVHFAMYTEILSTAPDIFRDMILYHCFDFGAQFKPYFYRTLYTVFLKFSGRENPLYRVCFIEYLTVKNIYITKDSNSHSSQIPLGQGGSLPTRTRGTCDVTGARTREKTQARVCRSLAYLVSTQGRRELDEGRSSPGAKHTRNTIQI